VVLFSSSAFMTIAAKKAIWAAGQAWLAEQSMK
jgi:hypothetical protein